MKKGDLKRDHLLRVAEKLFLERGFEATSIQDIIDEIGISKGGFYHYFPSKEAILGEICENRIEEKFERARVELCAGRLSPIDKLNAVLKLVNLFDSEAPDFAALMLKIAYWDGDVRLRERMRVATMAQALPLTDDIIAEGVESGSFFARHPRQIGWLLLSVTADINDEAYRLLSEAPDDPERITDILETLRTGRDAVETLLNAPFGTVELFDVSRLTADFRAVGEALARLKES